MKYYRYKESHQQKRASDCAAEVETEVTRPKPVSGECVCGVVKQIVKAQDEVTSDHCATSCYRSIQQLRGKINETVTQHTTIPFILYCAGTCEPFVGSGVFQGPAKRGDGTFFGCVETPVFRAIKFVDNSDCCVKLELLLPVSDGCEVEPNHTHKASTVCSFFSEEHPVTDFVSTGICVTVDLNHFMGITCLDPVTPML